MRTGRNWGSASDFALNFDIPPQSQKKNKAKTHDIEVIFQVVHRRLHHVLKWIFVIIPKISRDDEKPKMKPRTWITKIMRQGIRMIECTLNNPDPQK